MQIALKCNYFLFFFLSNHELHFTKKTYNSIEWKTYKLVNKKEWKTYKSIE